MSGVGEWRTGERDVTGELARLSVYRRLGDESPTGSKQRIGSARGSGAYGQNVGVGRFRHTTSPIHMGATALFGGKKPGDDEQRDARPHRGMSASEQPSGAARPNPEPVRHRIRSKSRDTGADDRQGNDDRALGDLPEPLQNHATVSVSLAVRLGFPVNSRLRCDASDASLVRLVAATIPHLGLAGR